jgi:flagellar biosynthetic protein FliR
MTYDISDFITGNLFGFLLLMTRFGSACLFLPGIGESFVNTRSRVLFVFLFAYIMLPVLGPMMPPMPTNISHALFLIVMEATIGVFLGLMIRLMVLALEFAGQIVALQMGIGNIVAFNPAMATQGSLTGAILGLVGILLVFATNLHHLFFTGLVKSYVLMPVGGLPELKDMSETITRIVVGSFTLAVMMAAPFIVLGTVLQVGLGLMARLDPKAQIFFISIPLQMLLGFTLFALLMGSMMQIWLDQTADAYISIGLG